MLALKKENDIYVGFNLKKKLVFIFLQIKIYFFDI